MSHKVMYLRFVATLILLLGFIPNKSMADSTSVLNMDTFSIKGIFVNDQVTSIVTDSRGLAYFSLSTGIAEFDGNEWRLIPLTVKTAHQQLAVNNKGRIYLGSEKSLGQLVVESSGNTLFEDLYRIPDTMKTTYLAKTLIKDSTVYFIADNSVFIYEKGVNKSVQSVRYNGKIITAELFDGKTFVMDQQKGLGYLNENYAFVPVENGRLHRSNLLKAFKNQLLVPTYSQGIYRVIKKSSGYRMELYTTINQHFTANQTHLGLDVFNDSYLAIATSVGMYLLQEEKGIIAMNQLDAKELRNPVYYVYFSPRGSVWLGRQNSVTLVNSRELIFKTNPVNQQKDTHQDSTAIKPAESDTTRGFFSSIAHSIDDWLYSKYDLSFFPHKRVTKIITNSDFVSIIRKVELTANDSTVFAGAFTKEQLGVQSLQQADTIIYQFTNEQNAFRFTYTSNNYEHLDKLKYQTRLDGLDSDWSVPTANIFREYTNLDWGKYTFKVKALGIDGNSSIEASYTFRINPPWHQTLWFFFVQIGFIIGMLIFSHLLSRKGIALKMADKMVAISVLITFEYINLYLGEYIAMIAGGIAFFEVGITVVNGLVLDPVINWYHSIIERFTKKGSDSNED